MTSSGDAMMYVPGPHLAIEETRSQRQTEVRAQTLLLWFWCKDQGTCAAEGPQQALILFSEVCFYFFPDLPIFLFLSLDAPRDIPFEQRCFS